MSLLPLLLIILAAWLVWTGRLQRMTGFDGIMLGLGIIAALMASKGNIWMGGAGLLAAGLYAGRRLSRAPRPAPSAASATQPAAEPAEIAEARRLLGLAPGCTAGMIREAHRRLIAKVHPDAGGTPALAEKINSARDILLAYYPDSNVSGS